MFNHSQGAFCQIETITNGTLVRYTSVFDPDEVAKLNPQEAFKEKVAAEVRQELKFVCVPRLHREDVVLFCKDAAEVMKAVNDAYENEQKRISFEGRGSAGRGHLGDYISLSPPRPGSFTSERF